MKTEEHLEPIAVFIQRVTAAVSELKDHLQQDYERTYPDLGEIIGIVLDEEEAKAWELTFFPHLLLPDMVQAHIANLNLETKHEMLSSGTTSTMLKPINLPSRHVHRKANGFHHEARPSRSRCQRHRKRGSLDDPFQSLERSKVIRGSVKPFAFT